MEFPSNPSWAELIQRTLRFKRCRAADPRIAVLFDGAEQRALRIGVQILEAADVERTRRCLVECARFNLAVAFAAEQGRGGVLP